MFKIILTIGLIQALAVGIQFIKSKLVALYLGPEGIGVVGTIDQFVQLAAYASALSLPAASIKFLSKSHSEGHEMFKRSYAGFFKLLLSLSSAGAILSIGTILLKPSILGEEIERYKLFLILGLLTLPGYTLTTLFINVFASAQKFKASSVLVVAINLTVMLSAVTGMVSAGIFGLYLGNIFSSIFITIGVMIYFRSEFDLPFYNRHTNIWNELKQSPEISMLAMMLYFSAIASSLSFLIARYLILKNLGEVQAGLLHGVMALSLALGMSLNPAINLYLTPLINRNVEKAVKIKQAFQFQRKMAFILSLGALPILMFPQLMLTIMFSAKFATAGELVFLFVMSQFVLQLAGVYQALLIGVDDIKIYTIVTTAGQSIFAFICLLLVPHFGIKGVGFGLLIGNCFIFFLTLIRLYAKHGVSVSFEICFLLGYTFSILFLVGAFCSASAEWDNPTVLMKLAFFVLFGSSLFFFLNKDEKSYLIALKNRIIFLRDKS